MKELMLGWSGLGIEMRKLMWSYRWGWNGNEEIDGRLELGLDGMKIRELIWGWCGVG